MCCGGAVYLRLASAENTASAEGRVLLVSFFNSLEHYLSSTYMTPATDGEIVITLFSQFFGTLMFTILYGTVRITLVIATVVILPMLLNPKPPFFSGVVISVVNDLFTSQIKHITWESRLTDYMKVPRKPSAVNASRDS